MNKQALIKLAQVRLAINHVIRTRAMQKQAEGGLPLVKDPQSDVYNPFNRPNKVVNSPWNPRQDYPENLVQSGFSHNPGKNTLGGLMDAATSSMGPQKPYWVLNAERMLGPNWQKMLGPTARKPISQDPFVQRMRALTD